MAVVRLKPEELPAHTLNWVNRNFLFGSLPFAQLWAEMGGRAVYWAGLDNERPEFLLPGVEFGRGPLTRFQAMPDGLYSRWLFPEGTPRTEWSPQDILSRIADHGYGRAIVNDFHRQVPQTALFHNDVGETMMVDISAPDWWPPDGKLRSEIRKAQREQVEHVPFSLNRHFDDFVDLMTRTERRHKRKPKYSPEFYRTLARLAMTDSRIHWPVCEHNGGIAASHIYLIEGDTVLYWQAFFDKEYASLKANQFMTWSVARECQRIGVTRLNMGASPPEAETLVDYKMKWGGETYRYNRWERRSLLGRVL